MSVNDPTYTTTMWAGPENNGHLWVVLVKNEWVPIALGLEF